MDDDAFIFFMSFVLGGIVATLLCVVLFSPGRSLEAGVGRKWDCEDALVRVQGSFYDDVRKGESCKAVDK